MDDLSHSCGISNHSSVRNNAALCHDQDTIAHDDIALFEHIRFSFRSKPDIIPDPGIFINDGILNVAIFSHPDIGPLEIPVFIALSVALEVIRTHHNHIFKFIP